MAPKKKQTKGQKDERLRRLSHTQSYEENRATFIERLREAGWPSEEASLEYDRIQSAEGELGDCQDL